MTPASPLSLLSQSTDDLPGKLAYGLEATLFVRVVADHLPASPYDAKTPSACISMFKRSGFPSVDASDLRLVGSTDGLVRCGDLSHADNPNSEACS